MKAAEQFKMYADQWLANNSEYVVPIIGSGVNMQAASMEGSKEQLDWEKLISDIVKECGVTDPKLLELPESFIRKWETVLRVYAINTKGYMPYKAEHTLQKKVQEILNNFEERSKDYSLYKKILDSGFKDIISLNFDRCLSLAGNSNTIKSFPDEKSKDAMPLYRHSIIKNAQKTRIWYPHGDTKRFDTIKLGIRKYGMYINWVENLRGTYMEKWYEEDTLYCRYNRRSWIPPTEWDKIVRTWTTPASWVNVFKSAPLLFIGCSLLNDEWPLWYLLNQRARQTAFLDQKGSPDTRPETIILSAGSERPAHLQKEPEYIINIHFDTYDEMWETVLNFFENSRLANN
ncbi:SIR2 family protein [Kordia sp.]|uniref:SIR2 family protein n=1 Tax=Kordia sp. TaxID=1965332 RepID=UPI003D287C1C